MKLLKKKLIWISLLLGILSLLIMPLFGDDNWINIIGVVDQQNNVSSGYLITDQSWNCMAINTTWEAKVVNITVQWRENPPTDHHMRCDVYAINGTYGVNATPTGGVLASSDPTNCTDLAFYELFNLTFSSPWEPTYGIPYAYVFKRHNGSESGYIGFQYEGDPHPGNMAETPDGGTHWWPIYKDIRFTLYGQGNLTIGTPTVSSLYVDYPCTFSTWITSDLEISNVTFLSNITGSFVNETVGSAPYSSPYGAQITKTLPSEVGTHINYSFLVEIDSTWYKGTNYTITTIELDPQHSIHYNLEQAAMVMIGFFVLAVLVHVVYTIQSGNRENIMLFLVGYVLAAIILLGLASIMLNLNV